MIHIYDVTIIDVTGCNNFQLFNLGNYLIKRQSEKHIII